ncbi:MAG: hypothetical protein ABIG40_02440 [Parcubacteria group bacterium]
MYWENCTERLVIYPRVNTRPIARKNHQCCECKKIIRKGERYSYFGGLWRNEHSYDQHFAMYKTCIKCEEVWDKILDVFYNHGESDAIRAYGGLLKQAILDAYNAGYLIENDPLVNEWLDIWPDLDSEDLSSEEKEIYEKNEAFAQMKVHSALLL